MSNSEQNYQQQTFDRIEQSYLNIWCRLHPEEALDAGIDEYADKLKPHDDESIGINIVLNEKCLTALEEIDIAKLDQEQQLHFQILHGFACLEHHNLMDHDWRHRNPTQFMPINALHQLTIRPVKDFTQALFDRLSAIPEHMQAAKNYTAASPELIPPVWLEMVQAECMAGITFCQQLHQHPLVNDAITENSQTEQAIEAATQSLIMFNEHLNNIEEKCTGDFACGREHFERLLHKKHFLPISANRLYEFGERLFEQTEQQLTAALNKSELNLGALRQHHPDAEQLLASYQEEMQAAYTFLQKNDLVSLPAPQSLNVVTTPEFLQHQIPFAAYLDPSISDSLQTGYYYVTPTKNNLELGEHNFAAISQTSVHEAWPGHHLQFVTANLSPQGNALLRRLSPNATLYEGWALYCEQLMLEQGFERHPGQEIIMLRDRLWRALRIMIDVEIHTRGLSLEDAANKMVDKLGFSFDQAMGELHWYSQAPTVPMSYAVGWALIIALREIINPQDLTELKQFHDTLLASGSIALPLVIQRQFGQSVWQQCSQQVFGEI